jgi:hypothetical protein
MQFYRLMEVVYFQLHHCVLGYWPTRYFLSIHGQYPLGDRLFIHGNAVPFCVFFINKVLHCTTVDHYGCDVLPIIASSDCNPQDDFFIPLIWTHTRDNVGLFRRSWFGAYFLPQESTLNFYSWGSAFPASCLADCSSSVASVALYGLRSRFSFLVGHCAA